jgi:hypothetical protein
MSKILAALGVTLSEPPPVTSLEDLAHALFENADPRQGMPGWPPDVDPMQGEPLWHELTPEARDWWIEMVWECIAGGAPPTEFALVRRPPPPPAPP